MNSPQIIDATLREGCQAKGINFGPEASLQIARLLCTLQVDMIECGHPLKSPEEMERVRTLCNASLPVPILSHSRAKEADIRAVSAAGASFIGIFAGINAMTMTSRIRNGSVGKVLRMIGDSVALAKSLELCVRYTVEDACRTNEHDLLLAYDAALAEGADRICFADTLGILEPKDIAHRVSTIKNRFRNASLEVHLHDDRGLALANSLAAVDAGADWVSTSINGLGERCGITDTLTFLANLHSRGVRDLRQLGCTLTDASRLVQEFSASPVDDRRPVVGAHAFVHKARLHKLAMQNDPDSYNWLQPEIVGQSTQFAED